MTICTSKNDKSESKAVADITVQLAALREMTVGELRERFREVFGEPTRSRNKDYLYKKVAWRIQELAEGGLSERALSKIDELAVDTPIRWRRVPTLGPKKNAVQVATDEDPSTERDPRLPSPGTVLTRVQNGVDHKVTVLEHDFEYQGERYSSLSQLARKITNTRWNGYLFWGIKRRTRQDSKASGMVS